MPEPVGVRHDVEAVTFIPGDSGGDAFAHQLTLEGLESAARLLRRIHDASADFRPPPRVQWAHAPVPGATTVCHGDPAPWNFVWRDGEAVGLIEGIAEATTSAMKNALRMSQAMQIEGITMMYGCVA